MTWWKNRSYPPRRRSSETAVVGHRNCGHQWALWRIRGEDRRIKRTETCEGVLCERWDSRRGSIRPPYCTGYTGKESIRERQKPTPCHFQTSERLCPHAGNSLVCTA